MAERFQAEALDWLYLECVLGYPVALGMFRALAGPPWCWRNVQLNTPQSKVLIVDDDSSLRRVLRMSLAGLGFEAEEAGTGEQALAQLCTGHYDLVLLDINMPGKGGIETCREIQKLSPRPLVLMLTVRDGAEDKAKAFEAGADDYITKPFRLSDLVARVRAALGNQPCESPAQN
jgi:two-component system, OmpR family, KDP operon response regulator KdpE